MVVTRMSKALLRIIPLFLVSAVNAVPSQAKDPSVELAAAFQLPNIPAVSGKAADWRQFDSFFTFVVKHFGQNISGDLKESLGSAFLDSRYDLTRAIAPGKGGNPVPNLFANGWKRLSPIINKSLPGLPKQTASQYANFISAADKLVPLGKAGSQLGVMQISPDALRGLARLLEPSGRADPLAFSTNVDSGLRNLLGFGPLAPRSSGLHKDFLLPEIRHALAGRSWFIASALAEEPTGKKLNDWLPGEKDLEAYLQQVRGLLTTLSDKIATKSKLSDEYKNLYRQIVFTAAWQESCWRQYIGKGKPLTSTTGDLGLMQVNRNTWRGVYDLKGLGSDIEYNSNSGGEILSYYLTRHAIKKNEDKQPGGNLARATYSAYNGGPSALGRYRSAKPILALKKVDEAFWNKFQAVSSGRELDVQRCYKDGKA